MKSHLTPQPLSSGLPNAMVLLDLETTGGKSGRDRIIEIALIEISNGQEISRWESLINPQMPVTDWIAEFTGISNTMLQSAPTFSEVAPQLLQKLQGKVLVAHNARFDYGFLKNAFKQLEIEYSAKTLCTVKLSKSLYPQFERHGLDAIVERLQLSIGHRHRAMTDTDIVLRLLQKISAEFPPDQILAASQGLLKHTSLPAGLTADALADLPSTPGVYYFFNAHGALLYVGKSVKLKERILSHFAADHRNDTDQKISRSISRIHVDETPSDFGAQLLENQQIKQLGPLFNRRQKPVSKLYQYTLDADCNGYLHTKLQVTKVTDKPDGRQKYGLFRSRKQAETRLEKLIREHHLCQRLCEIDRKKSGACFAFQLHQCQGACCGQEAAEDYNQRLLNVFAPLKLAPWPWPGAVAITEHYPQANQPAHWHVIDHWVYLGRVMQSEDVQACLSNSYQFDIDTYQILTRFLLNEHLLKKNRLEILPLVPQR